jgi:hypothetical protein
MINYYTSTHQIQTKLSGGRNQYKFRDSIIAVRPYPYRVQYGENYYTLAAELLGSESLWYVLADLNKVRDPFLIEPGDVIILAEAVVENSFSQTEIF